MRALSQPNSPVCLFQASSVLESSIKPKETECFALLRVAYTAINLKRWFYSIQVRYYFDFTGVETAQRSHRGSINKQPVDYGNRTAWADPRQRGARLQRFVFNLCRYSSSPMPLRRFMVVEILRRFRWKSMGMLELERRAWEFKVPSADSIRCYCSENYPASLRFLSSACSSICLELPAAVLHAEDLYASFTTSCAHSPALFNRQLLHRLSYNFSRAC